MGCGASNNNSAVVNNTPNRAPNTTTVQVRSSGAISKPLIKSKNYKHGGNITQRDLTNMRNEFWATRTEGNIHMWQSVRSAAEALIANDLPLAQAILEASNIITPSGTMEVLYDERGVQYKLPIYCYAHPVELCGETPTGASAVTAAAPVTNSSSSSNSPTPAAAPIAVANAVPVQSSGPVGAKNVVKAEPISVKVRINPGDINMVVKAEASYSILELKHCIVEQSVQAAIPVAQDMKEDRQRIIFMGRERQNTQKLNELGFDDQKVVQVFLRPAKK